MIIATIPVFLAIAGALLYSLASNPKLVELGRIAFFVGLLALVLAMHGASTVRFP